MEGITIAPPPLTNTGRTVIASGTNINNTYNNLHLLHNEYANTSLTVTEGAAPYILTVNVPTWVQGSNSTSTTNPTINRTTYTCNLNGGGLTGSMRLVKQGDGILNMAAATHTYTGETNIWGGTVNFDGTLQNSAVWMNRFTTLNSNGGQFLGGLTMEYAATLNVGGTSQLSTVTTGALTLNYGARVVLDVNGSGNNEHDWLNASSLTVNQSARTVAWSISNGSSGTYTLPYGSSTEFDGFYLVAGRYQSGVKLDNISVTSAPVSLSSYTFQEPGTLTIQSTLSNSYLAPSSASFTVAAPYVIAYESADYSTINAASAYNQMGNSWSTSTYNSRWANWNRNYTYTFVNNNVNSSSQRMYVDDDQILSLRPFLWSMSEWVDYSTFGSIFSPQRKQRARRCTENYFFF